MEVVQAGQFHPADGMENEEQDRIHRLNQQDNRAFSTYEKIHSRLIG